MDELFSDAAARLAVYSQLGRHGKVPGTRELIPHPSYRFIYEIKGQTISVLALIHTSRQWPPAPP